MDEKGDTSIKGGTDRQCFSDRDFSGGQIVHLKTAEHLAEEHGVNEKTVRRAGAAVNTMLSSYFSRCRFGGVNLTLRKTSICPTCRSLFKPVILSTQQQLKLIRC
jgi:hypothetical protein